MESHPNQLASACSKDFKMYLLCRALHCGKKHHINFLCSKLRESKIQTCPNEQPILLQMSEPNARRYVVPTTIFDTDVIQIK